MKALSQKDNDEEGKEISVIDQVANSFKLSTKHIFQKELVKIGAVVF